jgi:5'-nucleotidase
MKLEKHILLTNDDGIESPGLWAAANALRPLGTVHVVAPREQHSGAGRSMPVTSDGIIHERIIHINGYEWKAYAVGGSPAQTVEHAILEILSFKPQVIISGINFGENLGVGITASGTIGAALEGACWYSSHSCFIRDSSRILLLTLNENRFFHRCFFHETIH